MGNQWIGARRIDIEMMDGTKYLVQTVYGDGVAYEMTAAKHGWPAAHLATMHSLAFVSWHALKRTGDIDKTVTFEQFRDTMSQIRPITDDDLAVGPTVPGQQPG